MNILNSIRQRFSPAKGTSTDSKDGTGKSGKLNDIEDRVDISYAHEEAEPSISVKDTLTSGVLGLTIGGIVGLNGRVKDIENEIDSIKSEKTTGFPSSWKDGEEPSITPREMNALKMISKQEYRKAFKSGHSFLGGTVAGSLGLFLAMPLVTGLPMGAAVAGAGMLIGWLLAGNSDGSKFAGMAKQRWMKIFNEKPEVESMSELNKRHPEIWLKLMQKN